MVALLGGIPKASELFGHSLGILGFVLMLMTETLYTLRKRSRKAHWGRMAAWLDFHIVTGIVGPFWCCCILLEIQWPGRIGDIADPGDRDKWFYRSVYLHGGATHSGWGRG